MVKKITKKVKVGVIGVGNMGKNHARVYSEIANLVAVSDINEKAGKEIANKYHAVFYKNYQQMLQNQSLDALSVTVPTPSHKEVAKTCLIQKIPTLVEKPITLNFADGKHLLEVSQKHQTLLMVGHIERFNPAINKLKKLINEGRLGKIISLLAIRVGISPPKTINSDVTLDLGIHDVDVFNYLLNSFPKRKKIVKTKLFSQNTADSSTILLEYDNVTGIIQTNWITPVKLRKLFVSGVEGYAELDYIQQKIILFDKILNTRYNGTFYELVSLSDTPKKEIYISKKEPLREQLLYFLLNRKNWQSHNIKDSIEALKTVSQ